MIDEKETEHRLTTLEECSRQVLQNHLPHIYEEIQDVKRWVQGLAIGALLAILGLIFKSILG